MGYRARSRALCKNLLTLLFIEDVVVDFSFEGCWLRWS